MIEIAHLFEPGSGYYIRFDLYKHGDGLDFIEDTETHYKENVCYIADDFFPKDNDYIKWYNEIHKVIIESSNEYVILTKSEMFAIIDKTDAVAVYTKRNIKYIKDNL